MMALQSFSHTTYLVLRDIWPSRDILSQVLHEKSSDWHKLSSQDYRCPVDVARWHIIMQIRKVRYLK